MGGPVATQYQPGLQRLFDALDLERWLGLHIEQAAYLRVGFVADAQATQRCALLHARCHMHGVAKGRAVRLSAAAQDHRPGVDAHAYAKSIQAQRLAQVGRMLRCRVQDGQAGTDGSFGFILAHALGSEGGLEAVAGVSQHQAAFGLHTVGKALNGGVQHVRGVFDVDVPQQLG